MPTHLPVVPHRIRDRSLAAITRALKKSLPETVEVSVRADDRPWPAMTCKSRAGETRPCESADGTTAVIPGLVVVVVLPDDDVHAFDKQHHADIVRCMRAIPFQTVWRVAYRPAHHDSLSLVVPARVGASRIGEAWLGTTPREVVMSHRSERRTLVQVLVDGLVPAIEDIFSIDCSGPRRALLEARLLEIIRTMPFKDGEVITSDMLRTLALRSDAARHVHDDETYVNHS